MLAFALAVASFHTPATAVRGNTLPARTPPTVMQWSGGRLKWEPAWKKTVPIVREYNTAEASIPAAAPAAASMTVAQACAFMQDPTLVAMSCEAKAAFLEAKGVNSFVIVQAGCVSLGQYDAFGPVQG